MLKKDCLDLPPKLYLPERRVEMTDEQADYVADTLAELLLHDHSHSYQAAEVLS